MSSGELKEIVRDEDGSLEAERRGERDEKKGLAAKREEEREGKEIRVLIEERREVRNWVGSWRWRSGLRSIRRTMRWVWV